MTSRNLISALVLGVLFSVLSYLLLDQSLATLTLVQEARAIRIWQLITELGNSAWMGISVIFIWLMALALSKARPENPAWPTLSKRATIVFTAVAVPGILVMIIKGIVGRARPYHAIEMGGDMVFAPFSFTSEFASWPSGHATTTFAFAAIVGLYFPRLRWLLYLLAALTAYSRLALGVHYFGDVIMGAVWGTVCAMAVYNYFTPQPDKKS